MAPPPLIWVYPNCPQARCCSKVAAMMQRTFLFDVAIDTRTEGDETFALVIQKNQSDRR